MLFYPIAFLGFALLADVNAYIPHTHKGRTVLPKFITDEATPLSTRRSFVAAASLFSASSFAQVARASGGATAGGAYLLRAKTRYAARVTKGAQDYLAIDPSVGAKAPFFAGGKDSPAEDFLAAAYLLANAFRANSTTAPDALPTVKKYKAFLKEYEQFLKLSGKKGGAEAATESYTKSKDLLKTFLASVEL